MTDETWPAFAEEIPSLLRRLGEVTDDYYQFVPGPDNPDAFPCLGAPCRRHPDRPAADAKQPPAGLGPGRQDTSRPRRTAASDRPPDEGQRSGRHRQMGIPLLAENIAEAVKYLERDRPLRAAEWLNSSRQATISCWAAAHGLEYAGYANVAAARLGVSCPWPDGLEKTYSRPEAGAVLASATALADLQERTDSMLSDRLGIPRRPLARWVRDRLTTLAAARPSPGSPPAPGSRRENAP